MIVGHRLWLLLWVGIVLGGSAVPAADLAQVLSLLDQPGASSEALANELRAEGPDSVARLLALRELLEAKTETENIEARLVAHARLDRLDDLLDLVANQPHAAAGGLFWYDDLEEAQLAASRLHRPMLLLYLGPESEAVHRLSALIFCTEPHVSTLRDQFVLCQQELPTEDHEVAFPVCVIADANGRPVHALRGFCSPTAFTQWLTQGMELAAGVYQQSDASAEPSIRTAHEAWSRETRRAEVDENFPLATQLLFVREEPWYRPDDPTETFDRWEDIVAFTEEAQRHNEPAEVHQLFVEGIFTSSGRLLAQKLANTTYSSR